MASAASAVIVTTTAAASRSADSLTFAFNARPQAMTFYVRFVELGTGLVTGARVLQIGASGNTNPRFIINNAGSSLYGVEWINAAGTSALSTSTNPVTVGDRVELLATLTGAGVVQFSQSLNGAATVSYTASAAQLLPTAWSGALLSVNAIGASAVGFIALRNLKIVRGVQDMTTMRRKAGVTV